MEKTKRCTRCGVEKLRAQFSAHTQAKDGLQAHCKECCAEKARLRRVGKPCITCGSPKEVGVPKGARLCMTCSTTCFVCKAAPRQKQHRLCKACAAAREKVRNARPDRLRKGRITRIASKFQVPRTVAEVLADAKLCGACGKFMQRPGEAHVDHCHGTGKVRGVLCFNCNAALGHVGDCPNRLRLLIAYLTVTETASAPIAIPAPDHLKE